MADKNVFTDRVKIQIKAGDGGDGCNSFQSYKGKPACGPDGGDGGSGGSVYLLGDKDLNDLLQYRYESHFKAGDGERGGSNKCTGAGGADIVLKVPCGTLVKDAETGRIICDVFKDGEKILVAKGGRGGKGNVRFTTSRRHAPDFAQSGQKVKAHFIILEMKVIADLGIIGFPNVGKSTLLSKISAAKPKIANYHFTTLSPNLGVVDFYGRTFVAADIPGLIEGAAEGAGLGHDFLRHIERTRMLCHVVDISGCEGRDPVEDFIKINEELKNYSEKLASLPQVIACNKCDIFGAEENLSRFKKAYGDKYKIFPITAVTGDGKRELLECIADMLNTLPPVEPILPDEDYSFVEEDSDDFSVNCIEGGVYEVTGGLVDMLCRNVRLDSAQSMAYFQRTLKTKGVIKALEEGGCKEGDTVIVGDVEFDFVE